MTSDLWQYETSSRTWRNRDGTVSQVTVQGGVEKLNEHARAFGWPGHPGTRWCYLRDDLRHLWRRICGERR